jgi:glycerol-3-phosphate dehydrogenase (NAD(P)+)
MAGDGMKKVAVMGSGSWGTALGMVLADAGGDVAMWAREPDVVESINRDNVNERYHPGITLPLNMWASSDPAEILKNASLVILAVPAQTLRDNLSSWGGFLADDAVLVSLMKGIELGTTMRMSQVIEAVTGVGAERVAVLSGPNLAREIAQRQPAATTVASVSEDSARALAEAVTTNYFRPYFTTDVVGTEIGGSVKNVIALANGMAVGMGLGENTQASLITRGLAEMSRLGAALGAHPLTFQGLAGIGDLIATCTSGLSRNRTFGENLGKGLTVEQTIERTNQTCEGVKSCQPILDLATAHGVEMPITAEVVQVVHHQMDPREALAHLMSRDPRAEQGHEPDA